MLSDMPTKIAAHTVDKLTPRDIKSWWTDSFSSPDFFNFLFRQDDRVLTAFVDPFDCHHVSAPSESQMETIVPLLETGVVDTVTLTQFMQHVTQFRCSM